MAAAARWSSRDSSYMRTASPPTPVGRIWLKKAPTNMRNTRRAQLTRTPRAQTREPQR